MKSKRGELGLGDIPGVFMTLLVIVTVGVVAFLVLAGLQSGTTNAAALAAIGNFSTSLTNIITFAPTWGTVLGAAVLIGIVVGAFYIGRKAMG